MEDCSVFLALIVVEVAASSSLYLFFCLFTDWFFWEIQRTPERDQFFVIYFAWYKVVRNRTVFDCMIFSLRLSEIDLVLVVQFSLQ